MVARAGFERNWGQAPLVLGFSQAPAFGFSV
jgi:hypothetical protein